MMQRTETMKMMDRLEELLLKKGWPVPFSNYYLVNHEKMLGAIDQLRASLNEEMDARFIKAFAPDAPEELTLQKPMKKENSH